MGDLHNSQTIPKLTQISSLGAPKLHPNEFSQKFGGGFMSPRPNFGSLPNSPKLKFEWYITYNLYFTAYIFIIVLPKLWIIISSEIINNNLISSEIIFLSSTFKTKHLCIWCWTGCSRLNNSKYCSTFGFNS